MPPSPLAARLRRRPAARRVSSATLALSLALGVTLTGLPGLTGSAAAAVSEAGPSVAAVSATTTTPWGAQDCPGCWGSPEHAGATPPAAHLDNATVASLDHADALDGAVVVELGQVDPAIATPDTGVTISGTVHNLSDETLTLNGVQALTSHRDLSTRPLLSAWTEGRGGITAQRVIGSEEITSTLPPDSAAPFIIEVDVADLEPPLAEATLPLLVRADVVPLDDAPSADAAAPVQVIDQRSFLIWSSGEVAHSEPLRVATVLPLTVPADTDLWSSDPEVNQAAWDALTGPVSPSAELLRTLHDYPITFMVDPTLTHPLLPPDTLYAPPEPDPPTDEEPAPEDQTDPPVQTQSPANGNDDTATDPPDGTGNNNGTGNSNANGNADGDADVGTGNSDSNGNDGENGATGEPADLDDNSGTTGPVDDAAGYLEGEGLDGLLDALDAGQLWWAPYGDPDLSSFADLGWSPEQTAELLGNRDPRSTGPADGLPGSGARTDIAWPEPGETALDLEWWSQTWSQVLGGSSGPTAVIQPGETAADATPPAVAVTEDGTRILGYNRAIATALTSPPDAGLTWDSDASRAQRVIAETLAVYREQPQLRRSLLIALPRGAEVSPGALTTAVEGLGRAPWIRQVSATALLTERVAGLPAWTPAISAAADASLLGPGVIDEALLDEITVTTSLLEGAAPVVPDGEQRKDLWVGVLDQAYSVRWRAAPEGLDALVEGSREPATEVLDALEVIPTTINFLADEGQLQVTVANALPVPVEDVRVRLTPSHHRLQVSNHAAPLSIGAQSRATIWVRAQAIGAGDVEVAVTLSAPNGIAIGQVAEVQVRVQPMGSWLFYLLLGVAGVILVVGIWRAIQRGPRRGKTLVPAVQPAGTAPAGDNTADADAGRTQDDEGADASR